MTHASEDHEGTVSIGGRTFTNLRFTDDIYGLAGAEELAKLVERLDKTFTAYGIKFSAKKTKLIINNTSGINTEIKINGQKLETVTNFKYLGSVITDEGSKPEILYMIPQTTAPSTMLKPVSNDRSISVPRYVLCIPLLYPSSCTLVNHAPSEQSSKEEHKPLKSGAIARYYASHTNIMLPTRRSVPRSSSNRTIRKLADHDKDMQTAVEWSWLSR